MTAPQPEEAPAHWGRAYSAPDITVYYDAARCIHFAACVRGLPQVFNPAARPWIQPGTAPADTVAEIVRRCPTGALHATRASGPAEVTGPHTTIEVIQDGPLFVRGNLTVLSASGPVGETRAALCRCGASSHAPYCDGTHRNIGFQAPGIVPTDHD